MTRKRRLTWCPRCSQHTAPADEDASRCSDCFAPTKAPRSQFPDMDPHGEHDGDA